MKGSFSFCWPCFIFDNVFDPALEVIADLQLEVFNLGIVY